MAGQDPAGESAPITFAEMRPGCYDPAARVEDMDRDGVWAQLCFPTFARFAGTRFLQDCEDRELALACVEAYNDFMLDEWCGYCPDRQIPLVILPLWDVAACVRRGRAGAARGAKAISFPENPAPLGLPSWHSGAWDPLLAVAEQAELPLCMHIGTSGRSTATAPDCPDSVRYTLLATNSMGAAADLLLERRLRALPRAPKVAISEGGIGWMPYFLERIDWTWEGHRLMEPRIDFGLQAIGDGARSSLRLLHRRRRRPRATSPHRHARRSSGSPTTRTPTAPGPTAASASPTASVTSPTTRCARSWRATPGRCSGWCESRPDGRAHRARRTPPASGGPSHRADAPARAGRDVGVDGRARLGARSPSSASPSAAAWPAARSTAAGRICPGCTSRPSANSEARTPRS